jgi:hypothetical protein
MPPTTEETQAEANRLYWESDISVADIAEQLDISRRALYGAVEPLPAGRVCALCGAGLVFENRSARTADQATCPACGGNGEIDLNAAAETVAAAGEDGTVRVGLAALAGLAAGALVTLAVVHRR